jgi:succinate dehydrogenase/fumarate reductase-like Fe-S protein
MKTNHDGTVTLNAYDTWTSCGACGQRVTGDSIHTCSPQLKELTDEEIRLLINDVRDYDIDTHDLFEFARAILRKAQEK